MFNVSMHMGLACWLIGLVTSEAVASDDRFEVKTVAASQKIEVSLSLRPFDANHHRITRTSRGLLIDGARPIGTDNTEKASREFAKFEVSWNGKRVPVAEADYRSIYNACLKPKRWSHDRDGCVFVIPASDGQSVMINIEGGSGAASYEAWLVVSRSGQVTKFVREESGVWTEQ